MTSEESSLGPEHPFHMGYRIQIGLPKGTSEEDARIALGVVQEHFPTAELMEHQASGWDVSSSSFSRKVV